MPSDSAPERKHKYRLQFVPSAALHGALAGYYKIKLNKQGYRLVYGVEDDVLIVMVMAVDKREDSAVYQSATSRITGK